MTPKEWIDEEGWCGDENTIETSKRDPMNRACAAHDSGYGKKFYSKKKTDKLFKERMKKIEWLYGSTWPLRVQRVVYSAIVGSIGYFFWK